jgi:c-di-GMP-binding flagellar brake protein YcgR
MNKLIVELTTREQKKREEMMKKDPLSSQRRYFRKKVDLDCVYRPARASDKVRLPGRALDIGPGGICMEIPARNAEMYTHLEGDRFKINIVLPDYKNLEMECAVKGVTREAGSDKIVLGMSISAISPDSRKTLGFFLMP